MRTPKTGRRRSEKPEGEQPKPNEIKLSPLDVENAVLQSVRLGADQVDKEIDSACDRVLADIGPNNLLGQGRGD